MKAKLNKVDNGYVLLVDNIMYATDNDKLSKENCDEIFAVVSPEVMMKDIESNCEKTKEGYILGFQMVMELNKDKLFTEQDITNAMNRVWDWCEDEKDKDCSSMTELREKHIQSLQQPTEIDVKIEMECPQCQEWGYVTECRKDCNKKFLQPKLDSNRNLILKKL